MHIGAKIGAGQYEKRAFLILHFQKPRRRRVGTYSANSRLGIVFWTVLLSFALLGPLCVGAEDAETSSDEQQEANNFSDWMHETTRAAKVTFTDKKNLKILGVTALGSAALITTRADESIRDTVDGWGLSSGVGDAGYVLGGIGPPLLSLGLYAHGKLNDNERSIEASKVLSTALAIDAVSTGAMKIVIGRRGPDDSDNSKIFNPFSLDDRVFPSGHTSFSFTTATVMAELYDDRPAVAIAGYTTATLIGIARISDDSHWASDVLFGAVKGYLIGKTVTRLHEKGMLKKVDIIADVSPEGSYFGLGVRF